MKKKKDFSRQFYSQNYGVAIFVQTFTFDWQDNSIFAAKSKPYEQAKEFNDFQLYYFPFKPEKRKLKYMRF